MTSQSSFSVVRQTSYIFKVLCLVILLHCQFGYIIQRRLPRHPIFSRACLFYKQSYLSCHDGVCLCACGHLVSTFDHRWLLFQKVPIIDTRWLKFQMVSTFDNRCLLFQQVPVIDTRWGPLSYQQAHEYDCLMNMQDHTNYLDEYQ